MPATLVLGGPGSGRTRHALSLLRDHDQATYVVTGTDEAQDVPSAWGTVRTVELTRTLLSARRPVLIDCLTGWIRAHLAGQDLWDDPVQAREAVRPLLAELVVAARAVPVHVVLVGQELVTASPPEDPRQRLLVELSAEVNAQLSAACSTLHVVIAGRVLDLSGAPIVR
jgi:adenosylcobinamide kinase / adenosylcobinamide-phosphate guanylyltransferase